MSKSLVPVQHRMRVPADRVRAELLVRRWAGARHLVDAQPDPTRPFRPGDQHLSVIVTTLEQVKAPVRWDRILLAAAVLVTAVGVTAAILIDFHLFVGALILLGVFVLAYAYDKGQGSK